MKRSWHVKKEVELNQPLERVYDYLRHWENVAEWDPSVFEAHSLTKGSPTVGHRYRIALRFAGQRIFMVYTITGLDSNGTIELIGKGRHFQVVDRIQLEKSEPGSRLIYRIEVTFDRSWNRISDLVGRWIFENYAGKAILRLRQMMGGSRKVPRLDPMTRLADKAILPGLIGFTRLGYARAKYRRPVASALYQNRLMVLTGGTSGIGKAAARMLYRKGAHLVVVGRDAAKLAALCRELEASRTDGRIETERADLSLMTDVRLLASRLIERYDRIDVLINNAGALFNRYAETSEGIERTMATDLVSPYLLTNLLLPALKASGSARIINVSSGGMYTQAMRAKMLYADASSYDGPTAYARAKRGLVNLTPIWAKKLVPWGISVHTMHPGWVDTPGLETSLPTFHGQLSRWLRTAEQGADTIVWLAASPDAARTSGRFWLDRKIRETNVFPYTRPTDKDCSDLMTELDDITGLNGSPLSRG
jgi:NAD(P)-dependent dehydrogenase (short-subunit alcohol dehydrogenase family)